MPDSTGRATQVVVYDDTFAIPNPEHTFQWSTERLAEAYDGDTVFVPVTSLQSAGQLADIIAGIQGPVDVLFETHMNAGGYYSYGEGEDQVAANSLVATFYDQFAAMPGNVRTIMMGGCRSGGALTALEMLPPGTFLFVASPADSLDARTYDAQLLEQDGFGYDEFSDYYLAKLANTDPRVVLRVNDASPNRAEYNLDSVPDAISDTFGIAGYGIVSLKEQMQIYLNQNHVFSDAAYEQAKAVFDKSYWLEGGFNPNSLFNGPASVRDKLENGEFPDDLELPFAYVLTYLELQETGQIEQWHQQALGNAVPAIVQEEAAATETESPGLLDTLCLGPLGLPIAAARAVKNGVVSLWDKGREWVQSWSGEGDTETMEEEPDNVVSLVSSDATSGESANFEEILTGSAEVYTLGTYTGSQTEISSQTVQDARDGTKVRSVAT